MRALNCARKDATAEQMIWERWEDVRWKIQGCGGREVGTANVFLLIVFVFAESQMTVECHRQAVCVQSRDFMSHFWDLLPSQQDVGGCRMTPNTLYLLSYCDQLNPLTHFLFACLFCALTCCAAVVCGEKRLDSHLSDGVCLSHVMCHH